MLRCITRIYITQVPSKAFPDRKTTYYLDFANDYEASDTWSELTNKGKLTIPKNIFVRDSNNKVISFNDLNVGGFNSSSQSPLFLRLDKIVITYGYKYPNNLGNEIEETNVIFTGYITKVGAKKPIELELEDNMFILKQTPVPHDKIYTGSLEDMLKDILKNTSFTVNTLTTTSIGRVQVSNKETVAQVLARLKKDYFMHSYFRGNQLRCGALVYIEKEAVKSVFDFQKNIIEDDLIYQRKDDITLSAVARNSIEEDNGFTRDGVSKTKKVRLEVLVTLKNGTVTYIVKQKGQDNIDPSVEGERRTFHFMQAKSIQELVRLATEQLQQYYYTGLKGKFTTFGLPFVKQGDNVTLIDNILPERNGTYKVKGVEYKGGIGGLRQTIQLDYKLK